MHFQPGEGACRQGEELANCRLRPERAECQVKWTKKLLFLFFYLLFLSTFKEQKSDSWKLFGEKERRENVGAAQQLNRNVG